MSKYKLFVSNTFTEVEAEYDLQALDEAVLSLKGRLTQDHFTIWEKDGVSVYPLAHSNKIELVHIADVIKELRSVVDDLFLSNFIDIEEEETLHLIWDKIEKRHIKELDNNH